jgi:phosphoribosylformimino-5-aminoimidazole carboxamide ribotide isomerase
MTTDFQVIPAIDMLGGRCVRLVQGDYHRETVYKGSPVEKAVKWRAEGASFLHLVDLDGAKNGAPVNLSLAGEIKKASGLPCEFGGGIRTEADADKAFETGVDRVIIGTAACSNPGFVESLLKNHGADRIVVGIDAKDGKVLIKGWVEASHYGALELAEKFADAGVVRIIYTDTAFDGMLKGPNFGAFEKMCAAVPHVKIIASGGVSSADDIARLASLGASNLEGAIVGKALYDERVTLRQLLDAASFGSEKNARGN